MAGSGSGSWTLPNKDRVGRTLLRATTNPLQVFWKPLIIIMEDAMRPIDLELLALRQADGAGSARTSAQSTVASARAG